MHCSEEGIIGYNQTQTKKNDRKKKIVGAFLRQKTNRA